MAALSWGAASDAMGYARFTFISPPAGAVVRPGETVTITWTGGDPDWLVDVALVSVSPFQVVGYLALSIPNSGSTSWVFPSTLPHGSSPCGRQFLFYVQEVDQSTWAYGPTFTVVCGESVAIDIHPGSDPNAVNPAGQGRVPVAILSTNVFDATTVDVGTVRLGPGNASAARATFEDVDGDGDLDALLSFSTPEIGLACGDAALALTGQTYSDLAIEGTDAIKTAGCP